MNKYLKIFHYLFNFCCDTFDNRTPVSYTVKHQSRRLDQQLYYLNMDDSQSICDISLYL